MRRALSAALAVVAVLGLAACSPRDKATVVPDTTLRPVVPVPEPAGPRR
jgi:hypothetical protein